MKNCKPQSLFFEFPMFKLKSRFDLFLRFVSFWLEYHIFALK